MEKESTRTCLPKSVYKRATQLLQPGSRIWTPICPQFSSSNLRPSVPNLRVSSLCFLLQHLPNVQSPTFPCLRRLGSTFSGVRRRDVTSYKFTIALSHALAFEVERRSQRCGARSNGRKQQAVEAHRTIDFAQGLGCDRWFARRCCVRRRICNSCL
jgi:hypothetical protein